MENLSLTKQCYVFFHPPREEKHLCTLNPALVLLSQVLCKGGDETLLLGLEAGGGDKKSRAVGFKR